MKKKYKFISILIITLLITPLLAQGIADAVSNENDMSYKETVIIKPKNTHNLKIISAKKRIKIEDYIQCIEFFSSSFIQWSGTLLIIIESKSKYITAKYAIWSKSTFT